MAERSCTLCGSDDVIFYAAEYPDELDVLECQDCGDTVAVTIL